MPNIYLNRLRFLCDHIPPLLKRIDKDSLAYKAAPHKWSKKEIIGHLIDSATNNHHRKRQNATKISNSLKNDYQQTHSPFT